MTNQEAPVILIVDDSEDDFVLVRRQISKHWPRARVLHAQTAGTIEQMLEEHPPHLVVCDYSMPDIRPTAVRNMLQSRALQIPTILMSGCANEAMGARAMLEGFSDYVEKHQPDRLIPAMERELSTQLLRDERNTLEQANRQARKTDADSGFLNKHGLNERIKSRSKHSENLTIVQVRLSRIKEEGLQKYQARLAGLMPKSDIAKLNDQTFILLFEDLDLTEHANELTREALSSLESSLRTPIVAGEISLSPTVTVGLARAGMDGEELQALLSHAHAVAGVLNHRNLSLLSALAEDVHEAAKRHLMLAEELANAIRKQRMALVYQPVMCMHSQRITGVEALVRWEHPVLGKVMPDEFIQIAEDNGLIEPLGQLVLDQACRFLQSTENAGKSLWCAINCSPTQLMDPGFANTIEKRIKEYGINPGQLELEITETAALEDFERAKQSIERLRALGCSVAMDDFGTGYSSLSHLQKLPLQVLKIDKSFVQAMMADPASQKIVKAVVDLGHALALEVHAEGIESEQVLERLREMGCDRVQGYWIAKPMDPATLIAWLGESNLHADG